MLINIVGYALHFVNKVRKVEASTQTTLLVSKRHHAFTIIINTCKVENPSKTLLNAQGIKSFAEVAFGSSKPF